MRPSKNCAPHAALWSLSLIFAISPNALAGPLITYPLGTAQGSNSLLDSASGKAAVFL